MTASLTLPQRAAKVIVWQHRHLPVGVSRELLEMVGLVEPGGRELLPYDDRPIPLADMGQTPQKANPQSPYAVADHGRRPENCTTPPGLLNLQPTAAAAEPKKRQAKKAAARPTRKPAPPKPQRQRRAIAQCGTVSGDSRHRRLGETPCAPCKQARSDYQRQLYARRRATPVARSVPACGTPAGYQAHRRNGQAACEPCLEALRVYHRQRRDAARMEAAS